MTFLPTKRRLFNSVLSLLILALASACSRPEQEPTPTASPLPPTTLASTATPPSPTASSTASPTLLPPTRTARPATPTKTEPPPTSTPSGPTSTPNPVLATGLLGFWQGSNGSFYIFNADGTWNWDERLSQVQKAPENTGSWWLQGDVMYMVDLTGPGACPRSQVGSYAVSFEGDTLTLRLTHDACGVRATQTAGLYLRPSSTPSP